tara:strand:- start:2985 stop:3365 length:381 start_codon:yes stop_codon:yes gene_type:complete
MEINDEKNKIVEQWANVESEVVPVNRRLKDNPAASILVNAGTDSFAHNAAKGHICIPHRWNVQKEALERCGLGHHVKKEIPFIVRESFAKNLGTGCENTHFIQFEGQTNKENFIASHFKKPDNASK